MSKILKIAALVVAVAAIVVATGGAAAIGIGTAGASATAGGVAVGAYTAGTGFAITATAATAATAATIGGVSAATLSLVAGGLSIAANLTAARPTAGGNVTQFKADPNAGIPYVIGRTFNAGNVIYRRTHNTTGYSLPDLQTNVVILSGAGPVQAIEAFTADKSVVSFSGGNAIGGFATWMFQNTQLGQTPESAALSNAGLFVSTGKVTSAAPSWGAGNKLSGYAAAIWTLRYDLKSKIYSQGAPVPGWIIQGVKVYDPRLDSTYPGGSGSCRALIESTYVYSENPYLHALTYALGRYQNGARVIGVGAPIVGIDVATYVDGANVADANGWKVGGVVYSGDNKWTTLKTILQAGSGEPMHLGAKLSVIVNTPKVTLATVTVDDVTGEASVNGTQPRRDRINRIIPRYRSEAHGWQVIPALPIVVPAHVATDGGLRTKEVTYPLVQSLTQVSQLARYDIENAREFGPISLPLKLRWMGYKPGDQIAINLPEIGLNGQTVVIVNRELDAEAASVTLIARSETAAKHAFALGQTGVAPPTPTLTTPPVPPQPGASDWAISATALVTGANAIPALVLTGTAGATTINQVIVEYRAYPSGLGTDEGWLPGASGQADTARFEMTALKPAQAYEVSVSYRLGNQIGARQIYGPATAGALGLDFGGVGGATKPADNATSDINMYDPVGGTYTFQGNKVARTGTSWLNNAYSLQKIVGPAFVSATLDGVDTFIGLGPASSTTPSGFNIIPFAIHRSSDGNWYVYETGTPTSLGSAFSAATIWTINYDGSSVSYYSDGILRRTVTASAGLTLQAAVSIYTPSSTVSAIRFGPYADVTAASVPRLEVPAGTTIYADYTGSVNSGQLPRDLAVKRYLGTSDVSATTTWSIVATGCTASIASTGVVTITACSASGKIVVTSVRNGFTIVDEFTVTKINAAPPASGGTGATSASDSSITSVSSNTYGGVQGGPLTLTAGASGTVALSAPLSFSTGSGTCRASGKWQWRIVGGSFADVATEIASSSAAINGEPDTGYIEVCQSKTGLTSGTTYEFQLLLRAAIGSRTLTFTGTASAVTS